MPMLFPNFGGGVGTPVTPDYQLRLDQASADGWLAVFDPSNPSTRTLRSSPPDEFVTVLNDGLGNVDDYDSFSTPSVEPQFVSVTNGSKTFDVARFDGSDDELRMQKSATDLQKALPITAVLVLKLSASSPGCDVWSNRISTQYRGWWLGILPSNELEIGYGDGGSPSSSSRRSKASTATISSGEWAVYTAIIRGSTNMDIRKNGVDVGGSYSGTGGSMNYAGTTGTSLGSSWDYNPFPGDIAWAGFYDGDALGAGVLANMENLLMSTFGIT